MMNVLITGASGFVGGHIVERSLAAGLNTFAAIRPTSSKKHLNDPNITFVEINFRTVSALESMLDDFKNKHGNIDVVIHNAGVTKPVDKKDHELVNYSYSVNLIEALEKSDHQLKKFIYISSMAASPPGSSLEDIPININDEGKPVSAYGESKKKTELFIESNTSLPYIILRPPPVFGPRDVDMFTLFKLINKKIEIYIGYKPQKLSLIYVKDLAKGIIDVALSALENKKYFISDNKAYDTFQFNSLIKQELNKRTIKIKVPLLLVYVVAFFSELYTRITGNLSQINFEKINELKCTNWVCDSNDFYRDLQTLPNFTLKEAVAETVTWYKSENWIN